MLKFKFYSELSNSCWDIYDVILFVISTFRRGKKNKIEKKSDWIDWDLKSRSIDHFQYTFNCFGDGWNRMLNMLTIYGEKNAPFCYMSNRTLYIYRSNWDIVCKLEYWKEKTHGRYRITCHAIQPLYNSSLSPMIGALCVQL